MEERLIELFREYLPAWSWEEWQAAGTSDKEDIVINALADLGPEMPIEVDEAYDIFYDWVAGLTEADFNTGLTESAQKQYKITYREDGVSKSFTVWASSKAEAEQKAWSQVDADSVWVTELKEEFEGSLSDFDGDPSELLRSFANEYSYSGYADDLACISNRSCPSKVTIDSNKEAEQAAIRKSKEDAQLQAKCLAAAQKAIETGDIEIYNRGRWSRFILTKDFCPAVDPETLELVYDPVRKSEIYNQARSAYFKRQSEYRSNYAARRKAKTVGNIDEAIRVVSDPDVLYHATEVGPFYDILNSGVMLHDVRNEGGVHANCFTTDDNYSIYGYPCKIKFSRSKLEQDGYDLYPVDEFEEDEYGRGESEERCDEDINDVRKYVTEVIIDWEFIAVAQDGADYRLSTGEYDEEGNESDNWDLKLSDFKALLDSLKASGIKVVEKGQPEANDEYWFDENGEFRYGEKELAFA
jgi:hypothetical protein